MASVHVVCEFVVSTPVAANADIGNECEIESTSSTNSATSIRSSNGRCDESDMELEYDALRDVWQVAGPEVSLPCSSQPVETANVAWWPCEYKYFTNPTRACPTYTSTQCTDGSHFCRRHRPWTTHQLDLSVPRMQTFVKPLIAHTQLHRIQES